MANEQAPRTLFSEKEVGRILKRATELQEDEGTPDAVGLSLEEVRQIAAEVGVDPRHVATAVAELEKGGGEDDRFYLLGAPMSYELERVVEGEVSEEQWVEMVEAVRRSYNLVGVSSRVGRMLEWTHNRRRQQVQVRAVSRDGKTRIRIFSRFPKTVVLAFAVPLALSYMAATLFMEAMGRFDPSGFASLFIGLLGVVFLAMRFVFGRLVQKKKNKARRLLSQLERIVSEPMPAASTVPASRKEAVPGVSLPAADGAPEEVPTPTASRARMSS